MTGYQIEGVRVARWAPAILFSDQVRPSEACEIFGYRAPARFDAPAIRLSMAQPLLVTGNAFAMVAEQGGLVPGSLYLNGGYAWGGMLDGMRSVLPVPERTVLVLGNTAWHNHYHWLFQCLAPAMVAEAAGLAPDFSVLVPPLGAVARDSLRLCGIGAERMVELPASAVAMLDRGVHSNLTTGDFAFVPHPALIAAFARMAAGVPRSVHAGRRIYVARTDSPKRRMLNEDALCAALAERGFAIVQAGSLDLAGQIALFRDAHIIVSPHGAAMTNVLFARAGEEGAAIVELHQENYLHLAFLKICQAKGLRYTSVVSPMVDPGPDGRHDSTWAADIPLVLRAIDEATSAAR